MADMDTKSTEIVNCFPSLQCISGNIPDECKTGNIVCPTLPRSTSDSNITFPKPPAGIASTAVSSDSESGSEATKQQFQSQQQSTLTEQQPPTRPIRPHRRIPHTIIERRYRDNLNTQIETLRLSLPSLKNAYVCSPDVEDSALPPRLPSKAMIIATAATYIKELEQERQAAMEAVGNLQQQVVDLQKLIQCNDCSILQYLQAVGGGQGQQGGGQGGVVA
ncbi:hypothetical protein CKM354_001090300 [Cercospora kikuchii]|uniref:BHLH domain-containing protein n=1 Tax=Cercospora kikuchii TaxID=84275 RepID=A0A9P3FK03_9PEZI|nr:uncharacterized protein CKM354_001090300 [Cercospora kikuchii]GIZ47822.1 hypothetical protein CKM354_001090300 [Cercospora kikuchii]